MSDDGKAGGDVESGSSVIINADQPHHEDTPVTPPPLPDVELIEDGFGILPEETSQVPDEQSVGEENSSCASMVGSRVVRRYTWLTKNHMTAQVITYGATITSLRVPDRKGVPEDVIAGFDNLDGYLQDRNPYFGSCIGRCSNYIKDAMLNEKTIGRVEILSMNAGRHHFNGGYQGFDKKNWNSHIDGLKVVMSYLSEDGEEGYPGALLTQLIFETTVDNTLKISMRCTTTSPTAVNISFQPYFNLAGHNAGSEEMCKHIFTINADKFVTIDEDKNIVSKKVVGGTYFDFRAPRILSSMLPRVPFGGYDVGLCVTKGCDQNLTFVGRIVHHECGRVLEIYSTLPAVHFYSGQELPDPFKCIEDPKVDSLSGSENVNAEYSGEAEYPEKGPYEAGYIPLRGKNDAEYVKYGLFSLSPQFISNTENSCMFPPIVLRPGEIYEQHIHYRFGIILGRYT